MGSAAIEFRRQGVVAAALFIAVLQGVLLATLQLEFLQYLLAVTISGGVLILCLAKPESLMYYIIFVCALAGVRRGLPYVMVMGTRVSFWGVMWALTLGMLIIILWFNFQRVRVHRYLWPFFFFALWVVIHWGTTTRTALGAKDIVFFLIPPMVGVLVALLLSFPQSGFERTLLRVIIVTGFLPPLLYAGFWAAGMVEMSRHGPVGPLGARGTSIYMLIVMCLGIAVWRYSHSGREKFWAVVLIFLAPALALFTLSRTSFVLTMVLLLLSRVDPSRHWRLVLVGLSAAFVAIALAVIVPGIRARFFHRSPKSFSEAILYLNTSGRGVMWPLTYDHALEKPWLGWGPGEARRLVGASLMEETGELHPHNEYLQILHDFGLFGLAVFLFAWVSLLVRNLERWRRANRSGDSALSLWSMATVLAILSMFGYGLVGNNFHYVFALSPLFAFAACAEYLDRGQRGAIPQGPSHA